MSARRAGSRTRKLVGSVLLTALAGVGLLGVWALPLDRVPATGPYGTGTFERTLVDASREETFTEDPSDRRELPVQVWYPTGDAGSLDVEGAPAAGKGPLPLTVVIHGAGSWRGAHLSLARNLASHGWVVAAFDQTWMSLRAEFPDGRVLDASPAFRSLLEGSFDLTPLASARSDGVQEIFGIAVADARFVLGRLDTLETGPLEGRLDLTRIGLVGHSLGGAVAVDVCRDEPRCGAVVDLDGMLIGDVLSADPPQLDTRPLEVPALLVTSGELRDDPALGEEWTWTMEEAARRASAPALVVNVRGAGHNNLTDLTTLVRPWVLREVIDTARGGPYTQVGPGDAWSIVEMTNSTVRAFLDRHVRGVEDGPIVDRDRYPFAEVTVRRP